MNEFKGLKIGDKVVLKSWTHFQPKIAKFVQYNSRNEKTKWDFETGYVKIELDWSEYGFTSSNINAHDEGSIWFRLLNFN